jgi:hypothetical protein
MTIKFSVGLRNKLNGMKGEVKGAIIGATLALVDGGASADSITHSGNGFVTAGFAPGDKLFIQGTTTAANVTGCLNKSILSVAAGTITIATDSVNTAEVFPAGGMVAVAKGGSLKDVLKDGKLMIYSGAQPSSPDSAAAGTLLLEITEGSGAWVAGAFGNGLEFEDDPTEGEIEKSAATWSGAAVASGTAGWFRFVANATDNALASTTLPRIDGSIGVSGADMNISNTSIVSGKTYTMDDFVLTLPEYYGA